MKKFVFSKFISVLKSEKFTSILILLGGFSFIFLIMNFIVSVSSAQNDVQTDKEIVEDQDIVETPSSVEETDVCYECGEGNVLGTQRGDCGGNLAKSSDIICTSTSFTETASSDSGEVGSIVTIPRICSLRVEEITYPVYWNGHNKYVNGSYDNRYDVHTGEWPSASAYVYGGVVVGTKDGNPIVEGNNYASIYEYPGKSSSSSDGAARSGLKFTLDLGGDVYNEENEGEYQVFYTPACSDSAPGSTLIGEKGCVSQDWSIGTIHKGVLDGNDHLLASSNELEKTLYPRENDDCSSFSHLTKVIEDKDNACIDNSLFDWWEGTWDIIVKITEGCLFDGSCRGSETGSVTLIMDHISYAGRLITIDSRKIPGDETEMRYVSTPCKIKKNCIIGEEILEATCVWPDYLYPTWLSSEYGSSVCDPSKNYASVISKSGQLVTFNFCEYDGGLGYFDYVQYVTKRCDCIVNGGCTPISGDELNSCKMMINGSL